MERANDFSVQCETLAIVFHHKFSFQRVCERERTGGESRGFHAAQRTAEAGERTERVSLVQFDKN